MPKEHLRVGQALVQSLNSRPYRRGRSGREDGCIWAGMAGGLRRYGVRSWTECLYTCHLTLMGFSPHLRNDDLVIYSTDVSVP